MPKTKLYIVEAAVLPEVFLKVCEAKELLQTGAAATVAEAASMAGISRSAFYKYKDAIRPFRDIKRDQVITMSILTRDKPGALSSVLTIFAANTPHNIDKTNIIPIQSVGTFSIFLFFYSKVIIRFIGSFKRITVITKFDKELIGF